MKEAFQKALEALKHNQHLIADNERHAYVMEYNSIIEKCEEELAQPEQEPVAWMRTSGTGSPVVTEALLVEMPEMRWNFQQPLYTTPPKRKPLTDEMRKQMKERCDSMEMRGAFADGWLSAEAAHNIKETEK